MTKKIDIANAQKIWSVKEALKRESKQRLGGETARYCNCNKLLHATTRGWYCESCNKIVEED